MIIGGAIGNNLIDRVFYGYVVDFIDVSRLHFPWVFNVADSASPWAWPAAARQLPVNGEEKLVHPTD
jgi:signal peptidase II